MKNYSSLSRFWLLLAAVCLLSTGLRAQSNEITEPIRYNDFIVDQQSAIGADIIAFNTLVETWPEDKNVLLLKLDEMVANAEAAIANTRNLKPLNPEFALRDNAIALFQFYRRILDTAYRELVHELYKEVMDEEKIKKILDEVSEEEAGFDQAFQSSQEKFAAHYGFQLEENELQEQIDGDQ